MNMDLYSFLKYYRNFSQPIELIENPMSFSQNKKFSFFLHQMKLIFPALFSINSLFCFCSHPSSYSPIYSPGARGVITTTFKMCLFAYQRSAKCPGGLV